MHFVSTMNGDVICGFSKMEIPKLSSIQDVGSIRGSNDFEMPTGNQTKIPYGCLNVKTHCHVWSLEKNHKFKRLPGSNWVNCSWASAPSRMAPVAATCRCWCWHNINCRQQHAKHSAPAGVCKFPRNPLGIQWLPVDVKMSWSVLVFS